ncbi:MAG TPA: hypothetical protein VMT10_07955 [Solirubrobacteraceae bacterium]|nr:hypothetical protein [Solirubrobacteraceae bacterium]
MARERGTGPRRDSARPVLLALAATAAAWAALLPAPAPAVAKPACPLGATLPSGGAVQWAFSVSGLPVGGHKGITTSYTHGHGTWTAGRAHGAVCHQDSGGGVAERHVVARLTSRPARLTGHVTRLGKLGVELVLPLVVSGSDDDACAVGTRGTLTLFASYYEVHVDRAALRFSSGCAAHDHTYRGSRLKVLITRGGAQVN